VPCIYYLPGTAVMDRRPPSLVSSLSHHSNGPDSHRSSLVIEQQNRRHYQHPNSPYASYSQSNSISNHPQAQRAAAAAAAAARTPSGSPSPSPSGLAGRGRFTEEWDASQRGSSIIDGPTSRRINNVAAMERTNSVRSFSAGDDQQLPIRNNTLKKKNSMRRTSSLRRSSSRRSNRAGSVRSLALHSASDPDDASSAFYCPVPTSGNPTDILANRFQSKSPEGEALVAPLAPSRLRSV